MKKANLFSTTLLSGALALQGTPGSAQIKSPDAIRPFQVQISNAELKDFRMRIQNTRFPDMETVADHSQGAKLSELKGLVEYWGAGYDWKKAEAKLNAYPQFITNIDGVDIHFIHVRSKESNALPLLLTHGWPGSVFEFLKTIEPLTNPTAYGGKAEDAFDAVKDKLSGMFGDKK